MLPNRILLNLFVGTEGNNKSFQDLTGPKASYGFSLRSIFLLLPTNSSVQASPWSGCLSRRWGQEEFGALHLLSHLSRQCSISKVHPQLFKWVKEKQTNKPPPRAARKSDAHWKNKGRLGDKRKNATQKGEKLHWRDYLTQSQSCALLKTNQTHGKLS